MPSNEDAEQKPINRTIIRTFGSQNSTMIMNKNTKVHGEEYQCRFKINMEKTIMECYELQIL